jgi:hypothetical protein
MEYYDKSYDRVSTKNERPLKRINRIFHKVTTTDDPMIRQVICLFNVIDHSLINGFTIKDILYFTGSPLQYKIA